MITSYKLFEEWFFKRKSIKEPKKQGKSEFTPYVPIFYPKNLRDRVIEKYYSETDLGIKAGDKVKLNSVFTNYAVDFEMKEMLEESYRYFNVVNVEENINFGYVANLYIDFISHKLNWTVPVVCVEKILTKEEIRNRQKLRIDFDPYFEENWDQK